MSSLGCVKVSAEKLPDRIEDTSTLRVSIDNQGFALLSMTILTKNIDPITTQCFKYKLNNRTFKGFLDSDTPRKLEGSDYYEHNITAKGVIC